MSHDGAFRVLQTLIPSYPAIAGVLELLQPQISNQLVLIFPWVALLIASYYGFSRLWSWIISYFSAAVEIPRNDHARDFLVWAATNLRHKSQVKLAESVEDLDWNLSESEKTALHADTSFSSGEIDRDDAPIFVPLESNWFLWGTSLMKVSRSSSCNSMGFPEDLVRVTVVGWSTRPAEDLIRFTIRDARLKRRKSVWIYFPRRGKISETVSPWGRPVLRNSRVPESLFLSENVKRTVVTDVGKFWQSEGWYTKTGNVFKRTYHLYGPGGTGKSTIAMMLAGTHNCKVYSVNLHANNLDDDTLRSLILTAERRSIIVFDDAERGKLRDETSQQGNNANAAAVGVSLIALLNVIDGIGSDEGKIFFLITNDPTKLDPSLTRDGRINVKAEFKNLTAKLAGKMFRFYYAESLGNEVDSAVTKFEEGFPDDVISPATLSQYLLHINAQQALEDRDAWLERQDCIRKSEEAKRKN